METHPRKDPVRLLFATLDGEQIAYCSETSFLIQIGKGKKGRYQTRYHVAGNLTQALLYYRGVNIGRGYKKRLWVPSFNKPLIARSFS